MEARASAALVVESSEEPSAVSPDVPETPAPACVLLRSLAGQERSARRPTAVALSVVAHAAVIALLALTGLQGARRPPEPEPVRVSLMRPRFAARPSAAEQPKPPPRRPPRRPPVAQPPAIVQPAPPEPEPEPVPEEVPEEAAETSEAVEGAPVAGPTEPATGGSPFGVAAEGPLELRQLGRLPVAREMPTPDYPRKARDEGIEGRVVLRVVLDRVGRVEPDQVRVVRSVPALDAAAIAVVLKWRFSPGVDPQGRLVRVVVEIPFEFSLH